MYKYLDNHAVSNSSRFFSCSVSEPPKMCLYQTGLRIMQFLIALDPFLAVSEPPKICLYQTGLQIMQFLIALDPFLALFQNLQRCVCIELVYKSLLLCFRPVGSRYTGRSCCSEQRVERHRASSLCSPSPPCCSSESAWNVLFNNISNNSPHHQQQQQSV